jgi:hypothetical protein
MQSCARMSAPQFVSQFMIFTWVVCHFFPPFALLVLELWYFHLCLPTCYPLMKQKCHAIDLIPWNSRNRYRKELFHCHFPTASSQSLPTRLQQQLCDLHDGPSPVLQAVRSVRHRHRSTPIPPPIALASAKQPYSWYFLDSAKSPISYSSLDTSQLCTKVNGRPWVL